jgi:hypothetical protein
MQEEVLRFPGHPPEPTVEVPADPGWHAPAYRFVNTATGQTTPLLPLAKVLVSAA